MAQRIGPETRRVEHTPSGGSMRDPATAWFDPITQQWVPFGESDPMLNGSGMPGGGGSPGGGVPFIDKLIAPLTGGSQDLLAPAIMGGASLLQNWLTGRSNERQAEEQRKEDRVSRAFEDERLRARDYMDTFNMDPVGQARDLFSASALADLVQRGPTQVGRGGVQNSFRPSAGTQAFISPEALANQASRFYTAAGHINPYINAPSLTGMGFSPEASAGLQDPMQDSIDIARRRREQLLNGIMPSSNQAVGRTRPTSGGMSDYFNRPNPRSGQGGV